MNKLHRILIGILALQVVLAVVVFIPRNSGAAASGQPLLGLKEQDIIGLTVTDDQGKVIKLAKQGDQWVLPEAGNYGADATKITPVLTKLVDLKATQRVAQTAASHAQLQVAEDKFSRKVDLITSSGSTTLFLGTPAGSQASHVRLAGQDDVYIGTGLSSWEIATGPTSWLKTTYVNIPVADISEFKLRNAAGEWTFKKDEQGTWSQVTGPDRAIDSSAVNSLVGQLAALNLTAPVGKTADDPAYGLTAPAATATFTYKSGDQQKTTTIKIGTKDAADNSYAVLSSDSEFVVRVAEYSVKDAVQKTTFAPATPTPAPATTPTP